MLSRGVVGEEQEEVLGDQHGPTVRRQDHSTLRAGAIDQIRHPSASDRSSTLHVADPRVGRLVRTAPSPSTIAYAGRRSTTCRTARSSVALTTSRSSMIS